MSKPLELAEALLPIIGEKAIEGVKREIGRMAESSEDPIKKLVMSLMAEAAEEFGEGGLEIAENEIKNLLRGKKADLNWASPRVASDAVAVLQNAERDHKKKAQAAIQEAGELFGTIGAIFFKAVIIGAL